MAVWPARRNRDGRGVLPRGVHRLDASVRRGRRVRRFKARTALALVALLVPIYSAHADLIVPTGSLYTNSGAQTDLGCTDVVVAGTLTVDTGSLINIRHLTIQAGGTI